MMVDTRDFALLLTCEHGGNEVPDAYRQLFDGAHDVLETHRGYDIGALDMARHLQSELPAPLQYSTVTRLLVDLNRSAHNPSRHSEFTRRLSRAERQSVDDQYHVPYWRDARETVAQALDAYGRVLLFSIHTFTPHFNGETRNAEIGLLYDPQRALEREFANRLRSAFSVVAPELRVRMNYPYSGRNDAVATRLRQELPAEHFLGVEIEVNQGLFGTPHWPGTCAGVAAALSALTQSENGSTFVRA